MIRLNCYDSILLCLSEICDGALGLDVTQLVVERGHGHGMNVFT